ncbi:MAG: addiction module protein [bacterium]
MEMTLEQMTLQLLGLPASSRALLAEKLIESLDETEESDVEKLWVDLAEERLQGILRGERRTQGAEDVFREARRHLK